MGAPGGPPSDDAAWAPSGRAAPPPDPSSILAGYRDFAQVARGGDSVVYRARQDGLDREVAVKVVLLDDPETRARFERELQITVALGRQHPHIVTVLATGTTTAGEPCLVMDYFELGSLHDRLTAHGPLPVAEVVRSGSVVADALSFAHGQGVLHRDVKPQNVLVLPTSYVLADFGLARAIDSGHSASLERFSYRHASPQVLDGDGPTVSDDVYSLGSTLYTLLDGRAPFAASDPNEDSALSYLRRARTSQPRPLTRTDLPPELVEIVMRCLAKKAADRYASADDLRAALDAVPAEARGWAPSAAPASPAVPAPPAPSADDALFAPEAPPSAFAPSGSSGSGSSSPGSGSSSPGSARPAAPAVAAPAPSPPPPAVAVDAPIKPPAEPEPVAVSALAQLPAPSRAPVHDDSDLTGLRPMEPQPPAPALPKRWPIYAAIVVVALIAGVLVGFWKSGGSDPSTSTSPTPQLTLGQSPSVAVPVPTISGQTAPAGAVKVDESLEPKITGVVRRNGKDVLISFTDPSNGTATFVITGDNFVGQADPGSRGVTIADQPLGKICFGITAWVAGGSGFTRSPTVQACTKS